MHARQRRTEELVSVAPRAPLGRAAVITTATLLGLTGCVSLLGVDTSASVDQVTDGNRVVDTLWSSLFVLGWIAIICSVTVAPRHPDARRAEMLVERLGALWLVTGSVVLLVSIFIAQGAMGLQAGAYITAACVNVIGRQIVVWRHSRRVLAQGRQVAAEHHTRDTHREGTR